MFRAIERPSATRPGASRSVEPVMPRKYSLCTGLTGRM